MLFCCDEDLAGKTIKGENIEVEIKKEIYCDKKTDKKGLAELFREANSINIFGKESVSVAVEEGFAKEEDAKKIGGVPHLQIIRLG